MYPFEGQPVDAALDENGQSHRDPAQAIHSSYPQATNLGLDYQQPQLEHTTPSYFVNVPGPASQSSGLGDQTSPDFRDRYNNPIMRPDEDSTTAFVDDPSTSFGDDPSTSFVDDPSTSSVNDPSESTASVNNPYQFTLDPRVGFHPMYNPFAIPHQESGPPPHPPHYSVFSPPIVSLDGASTLPPGSVDLGPLGEPVRLNESLSLGDSIQISPPPCSSGSQNSQPPAKPLQIKFWPYPHARPKLRGLTSSVQVCFHHDYL
jgi:hypothetical protein